MEIAKQVISRTYTKLKSVALNLGVTDDLDAHNNIAKALTKKVLEVNHDPAFPPQSTFELSETELDKAADSLREAIEIVGVRTHSACIKLNMI